MATPIPASPAAKILRGMAGRRATLRSQGAHSGVAALVLGAHVLAEVLLALLRRLACPLWGTAESLHDVGRHQLPQPLRVVHELVELVHGVLVVNGRAVRRHTGRCGGE